MVYTVSNEEDPVYLYDEGIQVGPIPLREARNFWVGGKLSRDAFYWMEHMEEWRPALHLFGQESFPARVTSQPPATTANAQQGTKGRRYRVLVADDDPILCEIIRDMLENAGIDVETAEDFRPACGLLEKKGLFYYDCVVTDYHMPGGSGVDLARWIKHREQALQVLLLTAQDNKEVVKMGLRVGIFDFQEKPLRRKTFLAALHSAIQQTIRQREERAAYLELIRIKMAGRGGVAQQLIATMVNREASLNGLLAKLETIVQYSERLEHKNVEVFPGSNVYLADAPFQGQIGDLSLLELAQLLVQSGKTGELVLANPDRSRQGSIYFLHGQIMHAAYQGDMGKKMLCELMFFEEGFFSFYYGRTCEERTIQGDAISLLLDISRHKDERDKAIAA